MDPFIYCYNKEIHELSDTALKRSHLCRVQIAEAARCIAAGWHQLQLKTLVHSIEENTTGNKI